MKSGRADSNRRRPAWEAKLSWYAVDFNLGCAAKKMEKIKDCVVLCCVVYLILGVWPNTIKIPVNG